MLTHSQVGKLTKCPNPVGTFAGVYLDVKKAKHVGVRSVLSCGSWSCPYCRKKNLKRLQYRIFNGAIAVNQKNVFGQKFLTLTCPGQDYRDSHTPLEAHEDMQKNFAKLVKALKKRHGGFFYLKVVEKHKSGFPHIHVLLSGKAIAHKGVKEEIESLWRDKYGMGFCWIVLIKNGFRAGIKYITKYLVKDFEMDGQSIISMGRYKRIFTASKGALVTIHKDKKNWIDSSVVVGYVGDDERGNTQIFERDLFQEDDLQGSDRLKNQHKKLDDFCKFVLDSVVRYDDYGMRIHT
jgi:hypothetical protein